MDRCRDCSSTTCPKIQLAQENTFTNGPGHHIEREWLSLASRGSTRNSRVPPLPRGHPVQQTAPLPTAHGGRNPRALVLVLVAKALNPSRPPFRDP